MNKNPKEELKEIKNDFQQKFQNNDSEPYQLVIRSIELTEKIKDENILKDVLNPLYEMISNVSNNLDHINNISETEQSKRAQIEIESKKLDVEKIKINSQTFNHFVDCAGEFFIQMKGLTSDKSEQEIQENLDRWNGICGQFSPCSNWN